jgi:hypothetical protein
VSYQQRILEQTKHARRDAKKKRKLQKWQWRRIKRQRRRIIRKICRQVRRTLPKLIVQQSERPGYHYIRWSSRTLFGKVWPFGRLTVVTRWGIPGTENPAEPGKYRYYLTSNRKVVHLHRDRMYAKHTITRQLETETATLERILQGLLQLQQG